MLALTNAEHSSNQIINKIEKHLGRKVHDLIPILSQPDSSSSSASKTKQTTTSKTKQQEGGASSSKKLLYKIQQNKNIIQLTKDQHIIHIKIQIKVEVIGKMQALVFLSSNLKIITVSGLQRNRNQDQEMLD